MAEPIKIPAGIKIPKFVLERADEVVSSLRDERLADEKTSDYKGDVRLFLLRVPAEYRQSLAMQVHQLMYPNRSSGEIREARMGIVEAYQQILAHMELQK